MAGRMLMNFTPPTYLVVTRPNQSLNQVKNLPGFLCSCFNNITHNAGVKVSATMPDTITAIAMVIANWRYSSPVKPPRKPIGINTADNTSTIAITGPVTSCMALIAAFRALKPSSCMIRSTFSSTTMASSTTIPMANTMPNKVSVLME